MFLHLFCRSILVFPTENLHVWLWLFDWSGPCQTDVSEPLEQQVSSCTCDQWWKSWSHAPIAADMLRPHFVEFKTLMRDSNISEHIQRGRSPAACVNTKGRENDNVQNQRPFSQGLLGKSLTQLDLKLNKSNSPQTLEDKQSTLSVSACHQHEWSR